MVDSLNSFLDNIKQKISNPLLGTIVFIVLFRYWDLLYSIVTFDDDCDFLYKQTYIKNYFASKNLWEELGWIVLEAFIVLAVTFLLLAASKFLLEVYEKHLIKRIIKFTDKKSVKTLEEFQSLEIAYSELFEQVKKANSDNDELEKRIGGYKADIQIRNTTISELNIKVGELEQLNTKIEAEGRKLKIESDSSAELKRQIEKELRKLETLIDDKNELIHSLEIQIENLQNIAVFDNIDYSRQIADIPNYLENYKYKEKLSFYNLKISQSKLVRLFKYIENYALALNEKTSLSSHEKAFVENVYKKLYFIDLIGLFKLKKTNESGGMKIRYDLVEPLIAAGLINQGILVENNFVYVSDLTFTQTANFVYNNLIGEGL